MSIAILATGNEIIEGDILNTNSRDMAEALAAEGLLLGMHLVVGDKESDIVEGLQFLTQQHEVILIIGGLGPTSDDRTRFALGRFLHLPLLAFSEAEQHLQDILRQSALAHSESNKQQTLFPEDASLLANPFGTAMGCYCESSGKLFFLLPGPPRECLPMFHRYVLPKLQTIQSLGSGTKVLKWRLFGVAESEIGQTLDRALKDIDCTTGYRLEMPYVEFKVWCAPEWAETVTRIIDPMVKPHRIASVQKKASEDLFDTILDKQKRVCILDEVTGGLLQTLILKPESYPYLSFDDTKNCAAVFRLDGLKEYWMQEEGNSCTVTIDYQFDGSKENGRESHQIPFRSANVIYYAVEYLSYRLAHLINQMHEGMA